MCLFYSYAWLNAVDRVIFIVVVAAKEHGSLQYFLDILSAEHQVKTIQFESHTDIIRRFVPVSSDIHPFWIIVRTLIITIIISNTICHDIFIVIITFSITEVALLSI